MDASRRRALLGYILRRSPNVGNANNVRNVNTTGADNNNNANNSNGVAPDLTDSEYQVSNS